MKTGKTAITNRENHSPESAKMKEFHEQAMLLLAKSIRFGIAREIYQAAGLYNIKAFDLCSLEGKTFSEFARGLKLSDTSAKRYIRIGRSLASLIGGDDAVFLTEKHIEAYCEQVLSLPGGKITLRGLDSATRDMDLFRQYLNGEIDEEEIRSIRGAVRQLAISTDTEPEEEIISTKKETATIITSTTASKETLALELWKRLESKVELLPSQIYSDIERYGADFTKWYPNASPMLQEAIANRFAAIRSKLSQVNGLLSALHRCDLQDLELLFGKDRDEGV